MSTVSLNDINVNIDSKPTTATTTKSKKLGSSLVTAIKKSSTTGVTKLSNSVTSVGKALGKAASATGRTLVKYAGLIIGGAITVGLAANDVVTHAGENTNTTTKANRITGDVLGAGANVATMFGVFAAGPVGLAMFIAAMVGMVLDMLWNPFKNYYNSDLEAVFKQIDDALKKQFAEMNMSWPLEVKPDFLAGISNQQDPNYEKNIQEYLDLIQQYYKDNGLITSEEVLKEEQLIMDLNSLKRVRRIITEYGDKIMLEDPITSSINIINRQNEDMLKLLALAAYAKKMKSSRKAPSKTKYYLQLAQANIMPIISSFFIIFLLIVFIYTLILQRK